MDATSLADDGRMFCYRHPDRETYIRCGRCDRPICTRCAMQGPVGFRCRQCGTLAFDPLTALSPAQMALGFAVAAAGGAVAGFIAGQIGIFSIIVSFFAGGIIAEAVTRVIGFKRGPKVLALVLGGIIAGSIVGSSVEYAWFFAQLSNVPVPGGAVDEVPLPTLADYVVANLPWLVLSAGAACAGAYSRLR